MKTIFTSILRGFLDLDETKGLNIFADPIIRSQVDIYLTTINEFLPTPAKCHYTFNLRDLSKVVQGILMIDLKNLSDKASLVYLWIHECFRVFRDRLINADDRMRFSTMAHEKLEKYLDMEWKLDSFKEILFGNYENSARQYNKLSEINALIPRLDTFLELYNADNSPMNLVFFGDCIQHLSRIARVLSQARGNAMLVGVGGSGRRSMARLGASMNE
jgi:dynein heavy chain